MSGDGERFEGGNFEAEGGDSLPPVDFVGFLLGLGQMALINLGELPEPGSGRAEKNLDQARHAIDILSMLQEKTSGNLSKEEDGFLTGLLNDLKMKYVRSAKG